MWAFLRIKIGLALLSAFAGLSWQQIVQLLFASADDVGVIGVDAVTGRGRINLNRAFQPIGTTAVAFANRASLPLGAALGAGGAEIRWDRGPAPARFAGAFSLSVSQPLRVEAGGFSFLAPTANAFGRQSLAFENRYVRADPPGASWIAGCAMKSLGRID